MSSASSQAHAPPPGELSYFSLRRMLRLFAATNFRRMGERSREVFARASTAGAEAEAVYVGHATVLATIAGKRALFDPIFSTRIYLTRRLVEPGLALDELPPLDLLLVTHGHHDHLDLPTLRRLPKDVPVVCAPGLDSILRGAGFKQVRTLGWWESVEGEGAGGFKVTAVPARHWGRRGFSARSAGFGGFVLERDGRRLYHAGDTAYGPFFREIGERFAQPIDLALLPIGAYRPPSFRAVHMDPEDALRAFGDVGARLMVPIHWGTFVISYEPPEEPPVRLRELAAPRGLAERVVVLPPGATLRF